MSGRMIEMLVPIAEAEKHEEGVAPRAGALENKVIGILDNTWEHYLPFAARIGELLSARYEAVRIVRRTKPDKTVSAPDDWVQEVATGCQVVINGVGA